MTTTALIVWFVLSIAGVAICGLFAGLETGMYSLNRVRLHLLSHEGHSNAAVLGRLMHDQGRLLATLLVGTNIATNLATSALGVILHDWVHGEWKVIAATVLIETPLLFIFAETLPKDLFAAHADRLVYPFARPIALLKLLLTWIGLLPLISLISRGVMKLLGSKSSSLPFQPRLLVTSLVKEGLGSGLLSDEQSAIVDRVIALADRTVRDEMVAWADVTKLSVDDAPKALWELAERTSYGQMPVMEASGQAAGVLHVIDALVHEPDDCPPLRELMRRPLQLSPQTPLREALEQLQGEGDTLGIVTENNQPIGIVSIKDLVEPITGELASW